MRILFDSHIRTVKKHLEALGLKPVRGWMIQSLFYFILFMTYLFKDTTKQTYAEVEATNNGVRIKVQEWSGSKPVTTSHVLSAKDVYHLIGALHLIQKELKEVKNA